MSHCNLKNPDLSRASLVHVSRPPCEVKPSNNLCTSRGMGRVTLGLGRTALVCTA